jgi:hypothetical protein
VAAFAAGFFGGLKPSAPSERQKRGQRQKQEQRQKHEQKQRRRFWSFRHLGFTLAFGRAEIGFAGGFDAGLKTGFISKAKAKAKATAKAEAEAKAMAKLQSGCTFGVVLCGLFG